MNIRDAFGNAIATADFNGDGILDLVVGDAQFATLSLLLGNGNGTFQNPVPLPSLNVASLTVADMNNDGFPDLLVATGTSDQIVTLLNNGAGAFTLAGAVTVPGAMVMAAGDFNNDGNIDVACATLNDESGAVVLLLGQGDGILSAPVTVVGEGTGSAAVAVGDFNADGNLDLVAVSNQLSGDDTLVLFGNGDGTFQKPKSYSMGGPRALGAADFNGDHKTDIVTANAYVQISLASVLLGKGDGDFQVAPQTTLSNFTSSAFYVGVDSADLNGDGLTDFVVAETTGAQVLLAAGDDQLTSGQFINTPLNQFALGDVNGDGIPDLVLATSTLNVPVYLGKGDGSFQPAVNSPANSFQFDMVIGDFNGDGKPDLAVGLSGAILGIMLGQGNGAFAPPVTAFPLIGNGPYAIQAADFNNDGKLDLVIADYGADGPPRASINVYLGNGDGTFQSPISLPMPGDGAPSDVEIADLNGDGNLDLVVADNNESYVAIYFGNGNGTFKPPAQVHVAAFPLSVRVIDLNGDGILDLAVLCQSNYDVGVLAGKGDGTFGAPVFLGAGPFPYTMGAGAIAPGEKPALLLVNNGSLDIPPVTYTLLRNTSTK